MSLRPAAFLDRDGVINRERGEHTWRLAEFEVLPGVVESLHALDVAGYALIVITNQSGIGLGLYGHAEVEEVHRYLHHELMEKGIRLADILYCPHHPSGGRCLCRKPGGLLLERAIARHGIDPARSVMIGDRPRDLASAASVGVDGILVESNAPLLPVVMNKVLRA